MSDQNNRPRGARQLSSLAANGGLVFYVLAATGLVLVAVALAALKWMQGI